MHVGITLLLAAIDTPILVKTKANSRRYSLTGQAYGRSSA